MFSPIVLDFGELYSIFIASIVGVHITLSYNVQGMIKLAISTLVCLYPCFFKLMYAFQQSEIIKVPGCIHFLNVVKCNLS